MSKKEARTMVGLNKCLRKIEPPLSRESGHLCKHDRDLSLRDADDRIAAPIAVHFGEAVAARLSPDAQAATSAELLAQVACITGNNRSGECRALADVFATFDAARMAGIVLRMPACGAWQPFTFGLSQ